ncbi:hypothetical protein IJT10_05050 [bacterium]|nr:hypothetical protein [bacterium]
MINGSVNDFLDGVYNLQELIHVYHGKKYFLQGYGNSQRGEGYTLEMQLWEPEEKMLWSCVKQDPLDCREEYLNTRLYDGKTFWEAEKEIEWVDF